MRVLRAAMSVFLAAALVTTVGAGATLGAKKEKAQAKESPRAAIEVIKGTRIRMAATSMADRVTRYADAEGDQLGIDGTPAIDAPAWTDISAVYVAPTRFDPKMGKRMEGSYPEGAVGAFYGRDASWESRDDRGVFVAVEMTRRMPKDAVGQVVEVGLGGDAAMPVQVGTHDDTRAGVGRFSLSGLFSNGAFGSGTTDVSGRSPGDPVELYNAESGVFGYYGSKAATWFLIMPRVPGEDSVVVTVRSSTTDGEVIDRLELPGGGYFASLSAPTGGFHKKHGVAPLDCRSLETYSAGSEFPPSDPEGTLIRYTAGMDAGADPDEVAAILGPAIEAMGPVEVVLTAVGSEAEPLVVEGDLAVAPAMNAVSLTFEAPAGRWSFALAEGLELKTPAGQSIIDHASLTGQAGVLTGPGLDGFVAGDLSCALGGSEVDATDPNEPEPTEQATEG